MQYIKMYLYDNTAPGAIRVIAYLWHGILLTLKRRGDGQAQH
jgi:hypothetical protein